MSLLLARIATTHRTPHDPFFSSVTSLLHFDGPNGSTTFTDQRANVWTATATAAISTAQSKFGGSSGNFTSASNINTPSSANFGFGSGDFTIEGWCYPPTIGADQALLDNRTGSNAGFGIYLSVASGGASGLSYANNAAVVGTSTAGNIAANTWTYWAITRASGTVRGFVSGTQVFSITDSRTLATTSTCFIGQTYVAGQSGLTYIDELRITKGIARYTSNFTAPTAPFPNS